MFGLTRLLTIADLFQQKKQFSVSAKTSGLVSVIGGVFSLAIIAFSLQYGVKQWQYLAQHGGQNIVAVTKENFFGENDWLNLTAGQSDPKTGYVFRMAFSIVDSKNYQSITDLDQIGTLEIRNIAEFAGSTLQFSSKIVKNHNCTETELFNIIPKLRRDSDQFKAPWQCLNDNQNINFQNSPYGALNSFLSIGIKPCLGDNCYNSTYRDQRVSELILIIYLTDQRFFQNEYENLPVNQSSRMFEVKLASQTNTKAQLQRDQVTLLDEQIYNFISGQPNVIQMISSTESTTEPLSEWFSVNFQYFYQFQILLSLDQKQFDRSNYTLQNYIGDVGAFVQTLIQIAQFVLYLVFQIEVFMDNHLLNGIFRKRKFTQNKSVTNLFNTNHISVSYFHWLKQIPYLFFYKCLKLRKQRYTIIKRVGMRRIERELDIIYFIRNQLAMKAMIKAMSTKLARRLSRRSYNLIVDDSQEEATTSETGSDFDITTCRPVTSLELELFNMLRKRKSQPQLTLGSQNATQILDMLDQSQLDNFECNSNQLVEMAAPIDDFSGPSPGFKKQAGQQIKAKMKQTQFLALRTVGQQ